MRGTLLFMNSTDFLITFEVKLSKTDLVPFAFPFLPLPGRWSWACHVTFDP